MTQYDSDPMMDSSADENSGVTLSDGSTVDTVIFNNLESSLQSEDREDFQQNRFTRRKSSDDVTPFTAQPLGTVRNVANVRHEERSEVAQGTDEAFNAPIAPDYETWRKNPDQYDLPGIDTIPQEERDKRGRAAAEAAQEAGLVDRVEREPFDAVGRRGEFTAEVPDRIVTDEDDIDTSIQARPDLDDESPVFQEGPVLAHETGHAIDFAAGGPTERFGSEFDFFEGREEDLRAEAERLTERVRGSIEDDSRSYREDSRELVADAFASMAVEPRAARREAPNLVDALQTEFVDEVDDDGALSQRIGGD